MTYKSLLWLFAIWNCLIGIVQNFEMNMTEYFQMPNLYDFDDYDRCLQEFGNLSTYCFVRAEVIPNNTVAAWQAIVDISQYHKHHFDHRQLYFGLCVHWCEGDLEELDDVSVMKELYGGILTNNSKVNTYVGLFSDEEANRQRYNRLLNQCVNLRLRTRHGLKARSMVEYCDTNHNEIVEDTWNLTFYITVCVLVLLVTLSSFYDLYLKLQRHDKVLTDRDHYKAQLTSKAQRIFVVFSIARNWYRLNQEPNGQVGRDLRFLDCFKFFSMFFVVFAHTIWVLYEGAIGNPQDPERMLHELSGTLLVSGGLITVTFFVISGLLLTLNWLAVTKIKQHLTGWEYVGLFIIFNVVRYIRLTVPFAFMLLLSGVYFENPGGPLWRHIFEREQLACRKNWWTNLLYVNNYVNNNERCFLQSWYLAADAHSFVISLFVLMVAYKWPKIRNYLLGVVFIVSHIIPGMLTYIQNYYPIFIATPQTQKDSFIDDKQFTHFYAPFHMNFGCYFCGVLTALVYDQISTKKFKLRQYKAFHWVWYALLPAGVLWMFSAHPLFQHYYSELPRFWGSIYAAMQRNSWAVGLSILIVGMTAKVGWVFRKFTCLPIFRILGRLTYGAFLIHLFVARLVIATQREAIHFGTGMMFTYIIFTMTVSYVFSLILAIFVELPVSAILKLLR